MLIRRETPADRPAIADILRTAFTPAVEGEEPIEVALTTELFACDDYLPDLSLVAEDDGEVVGFVITTRAAIGDRPSLGLGPVAVLPARQGTGVGGALINATIAQAEADREPVIVLLGHTDYYPRFGFRPASELGIIAPDEAWGAHFQALPLAGWSDELAGPFVYARPFREL